MKTTSIVLLNQFIVCTSLVRVHVHRIGILYWIFSKAGTLGIRDFTNTRKVFQYTCTMYKLTDKSTIYHLDATAFHCTTRCAKT